MTPYSPAWIAHGAALAIRAFGLWQGSYYQYDDVDGAEWTSDTITRPPSMCAVAAIRFAATGDPLYDPVYELPRPAIEMSINKVLRAITDHTRADTVADWSDSPGNDAADVADTLDAVADILTYLNPETA